jgi:acyl-CoA dehydrogenase
VIEWSEEHKAIAQAVRRFVEDEIKPRRQELEFGDTPPYELLRKLIRTFGMGELQLARFAAQIEREKRGGGEAAAKDPQASDSPESRRARADAVAMQIIPTIEICRYCPGMVTAMGVSIGLTVGTIMTRGTTEQKERFVPALLTMEKIGAWAITEPGSGSDAFGSMQSTAKRDEIGRAHV